MRVSQKLFTRIAALFSVMLLTQCCCCIIPLPLSAQSGALETLSQSLPWLEPLTAGLLLP